jgi:uncharacterized protein YbaA (DUF1428 family)
MAGIFYSPEMQRRSRVSPQGDCVARQVTFHSELNSPVGKNRPILYAGWRSRCNGISRKFLSHDFPFNPSGNKREFNMMRQQMTKAALLVAVMSGLSAFPSQSSAKDAPAAGEIYELRIYTTAKDRLPALHKRFRDHTVALFKKHGMTNVIYWTPEDQPNTLVYLLKHKSVEARNKSFNGFRKDPAWQKAFKASREDGPIVTKVVSKFLKITDYSSKAFSAAKPGSLYELRTYTTNKGKLPNLNARFRDHTIRLFKKHGMHNVLYTTPTDEKTKDNTLVYVIAHKNREAANASWKAFGSDPAWRKVAKESQLDGRILIKGGVKRLYLKTTNYSPVK